MRQFRVLVGAFVVVVALAGCSQATPPHAAPTPASTATVGSDASDGSVAPARVFGGSCQELFSDDEVSAILGTPETLSVFSAPTVFTQIPAQLGGMRCEWSSEQSAPGLVLLVMPAGVLTVDALSSCYVEADYGNVNCPVDATANGIRVSGAVLPGDDGASTGQVAADALETLFGQRAAGEAAVSAPTPSATAWAATCPSQQLQADGTIRDLVVSSPDFVEESLGTDGGYIFQPAEVEIYSRPDAAGWACGVSYDDAGQHYAFLFSALGGGRWNEELLASQPGASEVTVSGFDAVVTRPDPTGTLVIVDAFVDDNWISTTTTSPDAAYPVLRAIASSLS